MDVRGAPTVVEHLRRRSGSQQADIEKLATAWPEVVYDGEHLDLVFTTPTGRLVAS